MKKWGEKFYGTISIWFWHFNRFLPQNWEKEKKDKKSQQSIVAYSLLGDIMTFFSDSFPFPLTLALTLAPSSHSVRMVLPLLFIDLLLLWIVTFYADFSEHFFVLRCFPSVFLTLFLCVCIHSLSMCVRSAQTLINKTLSVVRSCVWVCLYVWKKCSVPFFSVRIFNWIWIGTKRKLLVVVSWINSI